MQPNGYNAKYCGKPAVIFQEVDAFVHELGCVKDCAASVDCCLAFNQPMLAKIKEILVPFLLFLVAFPVGEILERWINSVKFLEELALVFAVNFHDASIVGNGVVSCGGFNLTTTLEASPLFWRL